jgi:hypothetical protein
VNGKGLLTRILLAMALAMICLIALGSDAHATPVEPNLNKILTQPHVPPRPFPPARAGWKGPETPPSPQEAPHPILERFGAAAQKRQIDQALRAAAIPDPRAIAVVLATILVLRRIKRPTAKQQQSRPAENSPELMAA